MRSVTMKILRILALNIFDFILEPSTIFEQHGQSLTYTVTNIDSDNQRQSPPSTVMDVGSH